MSKEATRLFEKFAIANGIVIERGHYGELLRLETRRAWLAWYCGWRARQKVEKKRRSRTSGEYRE